jgi:hypothetical protein
MRTNEKGTLGGMIDTEMWENRMNLEIHECGNASVEREWRDVSEQGEKKSKIAARKKNGREGIKTKKMKYTEETSVMSNERETSGAHQNDVEGKRMAGAQHGGPLQERNRKRTRTNKR